MMTCNLRLALHRGRGAFVMTSIVRARAWVALLACVFVAVVAGYGCGSGTGGNTFQPPGDDASTPTNDASSSGAGDVLVGSGDGGEGGIGFGDDAGPSTLSIAPTNPTATVTI